MVIKDSTLTIKPQTHAPQPESYSITLAGLNCVMNTWKKWHEEIVTAPLDFRVD